MKKVLIIIFCLSFILFSCASIESIKDGKSDGTVVVYKTSLENAWVYAKKIFNENGVEIREEHINESIFGKSEPRNDDMGFFIGVWLRPITDNEVEVTSYSEKALATKPTLGVVFTSKEFHEQFKIYVDTE